MKLEIEFYKRCPEGKPIWYAECEQLSVFGWGKTPKTALTMCCNKLKSVSKNKVETLK